MTAAKSKLEDQIARTEEKLERLKSKYIRLYGYNGMKMNPDGSISEVDRDD